MRAYLAVLVVAILVVVGLQTSKLAAGDNDEAKVIFEDKFDSKTLGKDWSWLHEDPKAWRIGKEGLEIRAQRSWGEDRKNVLLGPVQKAGSELIAEVFVEIHPTQQFEHANLQCYFDEKNWVSVGNESDVVMVHRKDGKADFQAARHREDMLWLRLVISREKAVGFYRAKAGDDWKKVGECDLPSKGDFRFGVKAGGGGQRDTDDWARFRDFRILEAAK